VGADHPTILIVDDEAPIREMVDFTLSADGFGCVGAGTIAEARTLIAEISPDLLLLDWMLPGGQSGLDFAKALRAGSQHSQIPIIMLTARADNVDKVAALDAGADDFISKPFSPSELKARIRAVLRRSGSPAQAKSGDVIEIDGLCLQESTRRVNADGVLVDLGPTEFRLLHFLMHHPERVYSRGELIGYVWPPNVYVEERTVDVHIRNLRLALEPSGRRGMIQTVRSAGYRFSGH
jgi:two-component system phosphate regulon response regulator PhoB